MNAKLQQLETHLATHWHSLHDWSDVTELVKAFELFTEMTGSTKLKELVDEHRRKAARYDHPNCIMSALRPKASN